MVALTLATRRELWQNPKILSVQMGVRPKFMMALKPSYVNFSVNVVVPHDNSQNNLIYLTALLNSRLLWYWFIHRGKRVLGEINGKVLSKAPVLMPDDKAPHKSKLKAIIAKAKNPNILRIRIREGCSEVNQCIKIWKTNSMRSFTNSMSSRPKKVISSKHSPQKVLLLDDITEGN